MKQDALIVNQIAAYFADFLFSWRVCMYCTSSKHIANPTAKKPATISSMRTNPANIVTPQEINLHDVRLIIARFKK
jgi:hypothetical protein